MLKKSFYLFLIGTILFQDISHSSEKNSSCVFNSKTSPFLLTASKKDRLLFDNEFIVHQVPSKDFSMKNQWVVSILNSSSFSKSLKNITLFSPGDERLDLNTKKEADCNSDYYQIQIKEIGDELFSVNLPQDNSLFNSLIFCKEFRLDDKIQLKNNTYSTIRILLKKYTPDPYLSFSNPVIFWRNTILEVLGKIDIFQASSYEGREKFISNKYLVKYLDNNEKVQSSLLEAKEKISLLGYDKCKHEFKIQYLLCPTSLFLKKKNIFKIRKKTAFARTFKKNIRNTNILLPGFILLKSEDWKSFAIIYQPIQKTNKKGDAVFSRDIVFVVEKINQKIKIQVQNLSGKLEKVNLSFDDLLLD
jgi:hypothetical protein